MSMSSKERNVCIMTPRGYADLKETLSKMEERLSLVLDEKACSREIFDFSEVIVEEMKLRGLIEGIKNLIMCAQVIEPEEQDVVVRIGNGVIIEIIEHEDESTLRFLGFVLEGYTRDSDDGRVSIFSPLGKLILGAKKGEKRVLSLKNGKRVVCIKQIFPPSKAEEAIFQSKENSLRR